MNSATLYRAGFWMAACGLLQFFLIVGLVKVGLFDAENGVLQTSLAACYGLLIAGGVLFAIGFVKEVVDGRREEKP